MRNEVAAKADSGNEQIRIANQRADEANVRMQAVERVAAEAAANDKSMTDQIQASRQDIIANHESVCASCHHRVNRQAGGGETHG